MKPRRNDLCHCGSGKKHKKCCLDKFGFNPPSPGFANPEVPPSSECSKLSSLLDAGLIAELESRAHLLLRQYPKSGFVWMMLGISLKRQGKNGVSALQKAMELLPDSAELHNTLGNAQKVIGQLDQAVDCYRRALEIKSDFAEAQNNLGNVLNELGQLDDAVASYRRALEINPNLFEAHFNLGNALKGLGQFKDAAASYRRALEIRPDFAEAHNNLGNTLNDLGRFEDAVASYRQALNIRPDHVNALINLSDRHLDAGHFAEAESLLHKALAIEPEMLEAWVMLADIRKFTLADAEWLATAEKIVQRDLSPRSEAKMRYAMGKYFDDTENYDRAFQNYYRANELERTFHIQYDRQQWTDTVDRLIIENPRAGVRHVSGSASASEQPLFIVGMARSGTSLIEQIIASHPDVFGAGELPFWTDAAQASAIASEETMGDDLIRNLSEACLQNLAGYSATRLRVSDKMPSNFIHLGLIHAAFPNARILHAQRNPIDTCLSIYFQNFEGRHPYAYDLDDLAHYYREYHRLMEHWRSVLPAQVFLDVPYEALVEDQEGWSRKIIEFIGLDWDERCLDFHNTERKVGTASNWQVRQKIYKSSKERWRNYDKYVSPLKNLLVNATDQNVYAGAATLHPHRYSSSSGDNLQSELQEVAWRSRHWIDRPASGPRRSHSGH